MKLQELPKIIRRLNHTQRCQGFPLNRGHSVAEHSFQTAILAAFVAHEVHTRGDEIDVEDTIIRALFHDLDEIYLGDIIHPVKIRLGSHNVSQALTDLISVQTPKTPLWYLDAVVRGSKSNGRLEDKVVKACDMAELVLYCVEEHDSGNRSIQEMFWEAVTITSSYNETIKSTYLGQIILDGIERLKEYKEFQKEDTR